MSEESLNNEITTEVSESVASETNVNETKTNHDDVVQKRTHERVLSESKKFKLRAIAAEEEAAQLKKEKLEEAGKYKELYETSQAKVTMLEERNASLNLQYKVIPTAQEMGCIDTEGLFAMGDTSMLVHDGDEIHGVKEFIESVKGKKPHLFKSNGSTPNINNGVPTTAKADTSNIMTFEKAGCIKDMGQRAKAIAEATENAKKGLI